MSSSSRAPSNQLPPAPSVVALSSLSHAMRLRAALEPAFQVHHVRTWDALESVAQARRPCAFFVCTVTHGVFDALACLATHYAPGSIILYAPLRRPMMESFVEAGKLGVRTLVIEGFEDSLHRLRLIAEDVASEPVSRALLNRLSSIQREMEPEVSDAIRQLVCFPRRFRVGEDLAHAANISLRTLYRRFEELELATPRVVVVGVDFHKYSPSLSQKHSPPDAIT